MYVTVRIPVLFLLAALMVVSGAALAQSAPARTNDITIEDYFTQAFINDCASSPDGRYVAYTEQRWEPPAETRNTDLWVVDSRSDESRRLTFDPAKDESPAWRPDSKEIYFKSARGESDDPPPLNGKTQVWKISVEGGEPEAVTRLTEAVDAFALSRDGGTLYYTISHEEVQDEWKDLREQFDKLEYGRGIVNTTQLWTLDLRNWRSEKLIDEKRVFADFAVSPDGRKIAMITTPGDQEIWNEGFSRVDVFDVAAKKVTTLDDSLWRKAETSPYGWLEGLAWSADSKNLAFRCDWDGFPTQPYVAHWTANGILMHRIQRPQQLSLGESSHMEWLGNTHDLAFCAEQKARVRIAVISDIQPGRQGALRILTPGDVTAMTFSSTPDGKQVSIALADVNHPADIYVTATTGKGEVKRLTRINPQIDTWKLPKISVVSWIGANGDSVEGLLELPYDYQPGKPLPMHVALHGGPTMADHMYFEYWIYGRGLWASLGWAVFAPNYHGSTGYGDKFLTALIGRENDIEVEDILKGVDAMVARGIADSSKLAVSGWSNGGFLTNCLITKTNRFKAASSGAGVLDMSMQWGDEDTPGHVLNYMQGFVWDKPEAYRKASPLYDLNKVTTPTLIHQGGDDSRVPPIHSRSLFRGLNFYEHVPCELLIYPGQGHGLTKYSFRKAKLEWDVAWFDKYVLGKSTEK